MEETILKKDHELDDSTTKNAENEEKDIADKPIVAVETWYSLLFQYLTNLFLYVEIDHRL